MGSLVQEELGREGRKLRRGRRWEEREGGAGREERRGEGRGEREGPGWDGEGR